MKKEKIIGVAVLSLFLVAGVSTTFAQNGVDWEAKKALMAEKKVQMGEIFENGTYGDWANLMNSNFEEKINQMREWHTKKMSQITEVNWGRFVEAHQLMIAGDKEGAQAIMAELGFESGMGKGVGMISGGGGGGQFNKDMHQIKKSGFNHW